MIFTKDLLVKGIAGLSVCAAAVGTGYHFRSEIRELIKGNNWTPEEIKKALGITAENCNLPTNINEQTTCSLDATKLNSIKFEVEGERQDATITGSTVNLKITKVNDTSSFPLGYRFVFESENDIAISTPGSTAITLHKNTDFKIKRADSGNDLTLEKAWNVASLIEKVGLEGCTNANSTGAICTIKTAEGSGLSVKQESNTATNKSKNSTQTSTPEGKIKLYYDTTNNKDFRENMKFVIEEGDITLAGGTGSVTKLEEFETYEIKESEGKYYLTRKEKSSEAKKRLLNLPCDLPVDNNEKNCENITVDQLKAINFENKGTEDLTVANGDTPTLKLKISKTTEANKVDYPLGYKFILESNKDITIPGTSPTTFKADTNTELKIKKSADHRTLTLGKAWTLSTLAAKVGLNCPSTGNTNQECSLGTGNINVNNGSNHKYSGLSIVTGNESKKVKYAENVEGFSQGFKFYVENADICLQTNGVANDPNASNKKIEYKGSTDNVHYQILKDTDNNWYLTKKSAA